MHASVHDSLRVAAYCGDVGARCLMPLLCGRSLCCGRALTLDLLCLAVPARVDKLMCMPRDTKYFFLFRRPSIVEKLMAKLERLITTNRLE